ncbi:styrene monooxygenase/indole monooxygenase family protein [Actinoallomurus sp. NPDC052274]|uniref:styrene monooxygenase/indole monooxygenase family protein n=1 Tax=Actinoallomurus sp. NPDC052274 TaxID=3155420 RepID=UPI003424217A
MRRRILIIGAGQAGLMLANSLSTDDYDVTVMTANTAEEIRGGRVRSTQMMFGPALDLERARGLHFWEREAPAVTAMEVTVAGPSDTGPLHFTAHLDAYAQSVDQRVKMSAWLKMFEDRGGKVIDRTVATSELADLTRLFDLTIIAAGKGALVDLFNRDPARSPYERPQRHLSVIYVHGMAPRTGLVDEHIGITVIPGAGELFTMPALTTTGRCDILFFEAVPHGPLDRWTNTPLKPQHHLQLALELMRQYAPHEFERCRHVEPADERCTLTGAYTPIVRHPVGELPGGAYVLGMGDVVVANDPIAGQGANNAAHCAAIYEQAIIERGDRPFDPAWMRQTFEAYWAYAQHSTAFSNALLGPLPEHAQRLLAAAATNAAVAHRFAGGYADPADFGRWFLDPAKAADYLNTLAATP